MKLHQEINPILTNTSGGGNKFGMRASAKAFMMLSSLYSNKIVAILRELGCNAFDSHAEAGYPEKPFEVTLPTRIEPWLTIQDYGVGLSPEQVRDVFTVYFESTKVDTNDEDGCLGIGSKSPFSYTDQFTVESTKYGVTTTYQMMISETGEPDWMTLSSRESDLPSGVKIQIPVKIDDIWEFTNEARRVYRWFETPPIITNGKPIEPFDREMFNGKFMTIKSSSVYNGAYALMGNVLYKIDVNELREDGQGIFNQREFPVLSRTHDNSSLVLIFPRGSIDFLPSRETLSYDARTKTALISALRDAELSIRKEVQRKIDACETVSQISDTGVTEMFEFEFLKSSLTFNGHPLSSYEINLYDLYEEATSYGERAEEHALYLCRRFKRLSRAYTNVVYGDHLRNHDISPILTKRIAILIEDGNKFKQFCRNHFYQTYMDSKTECYALPDVELLDELKELFCDFEVTVVHHSALLEEGIRPPKREYARSAKQPGHKVRFCDAVAGEIYTEHLYLKDIRECVRIAQDRGDTVYIMSDDSSYDFYQSLMNFTGGTVIAAKPGIRNKLLEMEGVLSLEDIKIPSEYREAYYIRNVLSEFIRSRRGVSQGFTKLVDAFGVSYDKKLLHRFDRLNHRLKQRRETPGFINSLLEKSGADVLPVNELIRGDITECCYEIEKMVRGVNSKIEDDIILSNTYIDSDVDCEMADAVIEYYNFKQSKGDNK